MSLQQYELGQKVWAFKQEGDDKFVKTSGVIKMAEINKSGYVQYQILSFVLDPMTQKPKDYTILANHASLAATEEEIDAKIKKYFDWAEKQKKEYEENFGTPEFDKNQLTQDAAEMAKHRG